MKIEITGDVPDDPISRTVAVEHFIERICRESGADPADAIMTLLVAAIHLTWRYNNKSTEETHHDVVETLFYATKAADGFFSMSKQNIN